MAASKSSDIVYLEDIQISTSEKKTNDDAASPSSSQKSTTTVSKKRQLTFEDVFASKQSQPSNKKLKLNSIPFSLFEYKQSLSSEQMELLRLECEVMGKSWLKLLKDEIKKPYFISLKKFLWEEGLKGVDDTAKSLQIYPPPRDIYAWSQTPLGRVKVVLIGQDPYHKKGQAHGLCFSVPRGISVPPSLANIYAELKAEYPAFQPPKHGNLTAWANNGVLMLNTCLTVRAGAPESHSNKGWEQFTEKVIEVVDKYGGANLSAEGSEESVGFGRGVVFLAWGAFALKRVAKLDKTKHLVLSTSHPSPFSANKGFLGCGHFRQANEWLERRYGKEAMVDWCALDA